MAGVLHRQFTQDPIMRMMIAAVTAMALVSVVQAEGKIDASKLVGQWKVVKSDELPPGANVTVEFTKDMLIVKIEIEGKKEEIKGTYTVKEDKLTVKMMLPDGNAKEDTDTIKELTDKKLIIVDDKKMATEFERVAKK